MINKIQSTIKVILGMSWYESTGLVITLALPYSLPDPNPSFCPPLAYYYLCALLLRHAKLNLVVHDLPWPLA